MGAVKNAFWDEITIADCCQCGKELREGDCEPVALIHGDALCIPCHELNELPDGPGMGTGSLSEVW